jgi:hypothetical protein
MIIFIKIPTHKNESTSDIQSIVLPEYATLYFVVIPDGRYKQFDDAP